MLLPFWTVALLTFTLIEGGTLNDSRTLVNDLLNGYNKNVRPIADQNNKTDVYIYTYMWSIQEFDEVKEVFSYTGGFTCTWHDAGMVWDPAAYGNTYAVKVSYKNVWVPDLILTTPTDKMESFGQPWHMINFIYTGIAVWEVGGLVKSTCSVDVSKYPFDKQTCRSDFNIWGYDSDEVEIYAVSNKVGTSLYSGNVAWTLEDSDVRVTNSTGDWSQLEVSFYLKRKSTFIVVNIIMPILFLSLINVLVFLLVPESGERVSFCITVLLAIAVFMTIISDTLPRSSEPMPIISFKLMMDMVISSLITLVTVLNLRLYNKDDVKPIPGWLKRVYLILYRPKRNTVNEKFQKIHAKIIDVKVMPEVNETDSHSVGNAVDPTKQIDDSMNARLDGAISKNGFVIPKITWRDISHMIDNISLCFFTFLSVLSFSIFLTYVSQN